MNDYSEAIVNLRRDVVLCEDLCAKKRYKAAAAVAEVIQHTAGELVKYLDSKEGCTNEQ